MCCRAEENLRCCGGYRGWLRTTKVALVATGQAEFCGSYNGRLKTTGVPFWLQRQAANHLCGILWHPEYADATFSTMMTAWVD